MAKYQEFLSRVGSNRDRAALRGIFSQFLTDGDPPALKDLVLASIILSGAETTQITISGASTTGILQSGTSTTGYSITGAFTTGISIAADGTTAIAVTSAFTGVNMISLAGTGSTSGIIISGACAIPLNITGAFTTGITIAADGTTAISITSAFSGVTGISFAGTASGAGIAISGACADGIQISGANTANGINITVADGATVPVGINIAPATTTGIVTTPLSITTPFTTGISIAADGTTGISITSAFTGVTGLSFAGTASGDGILISGACADGIHISGANTASGLHISGDQVVGVLFESTAAAEAALRATIPTGITLDAGIDINCTSTGVVTSGLTMQGTGTFTTCITLSATAMTTGIKIGTGATTAIDIDCATDTTSAVTGSIHTDGGVGIAKALWVGTTSRLVGLVTTDGAVSVGTTLLTGVGAVGAPAVQIGAADTGLYLLSATQTGFAQDGVLVAIFDSDGIKPDSVQPRVTLGTAGAATVTFKEYGDGRDMTTVLTLTNFIVGALAGAAAALGVGNIVYAFPAGQHLELVSALSAIVLTAAGTAVTTKTGLGSVIASGAVADLTTPATFQDRLTGQDIATAAGGGAAASALKAATAGIGTGISLNVAASVKNVFLNSAGTWNADNTGNLTASGTIVIKWTRMG